MSYLTAVTSGIAAASLLVAFFGREPARIAPPAVERVVVVSSGKSDREAITFAERVATLDVAPESMEAPNVVVPDQRRADDVRPVHAEIRRELPARDSRDQRHAEQSRVDPVCGKRGRVWYTKDNGWRYWRCVR
jgi:hypothetical protein